MLFKNKDENKKNELIKLSKLTQDEWKNIDQKLSLLEDDKKKFINTLPNEIVQLYDDLKSKGVEVIAGYKREGVGIRIRVAIAIRV